MTIIELSNADADTLQDAWHYAMMIIDRRASTFDGDYRTYAEGIRGQMDAYSSLLKTMDAMAADNETYQFVSLRRWFVPQTWNDVVVFTSEMMASILHNANRLGVEACSGNRT